MVLSSTDRVMVTNTKVLRLCDVVCCTAVLITVTIFHSLCTLVSVMVMLSTVVYYIEGQACRHRNSSDWI